jgi:hypothetical protein
VEYASAIPGR